ncbi:hypothetical protein L484_024437 [Morus notabilis]|uniref:Uncharacterized protein n=1 Tax=Morus notabilis TaxID=981085 RepID=W9S5A2_9ROSA|nr:hypothetical protein L484_024437 [Morus notabilis]
MLLFGFVELSGFILLAVQAHVDELRPAPCKMLIMKLAAEMILISRSVRKQEGSRRRYCSQPFTWWPWEVAALSPTSSLTELINSEFNITNKRRKHHDQHLLSSYFNAAYFAFCTGELLASFGSKLTPAWMSALASPLPPWPLDCSA